MDWHKLPPLHWAYGGFIAAMVIAALLVGWGSGRLGDPAESPTPTPTATASAEA